MSVASPSEDVQRLSDVILDYCGRQVTPVDTYVLAANLQRKRTLINRLELDFARDAACFAAGYYEAIHVNPSASDWMRENCHMTTHASWTAVAVGEQAPRLAQSAAALRDGRIGFAHLGLMASTAVAIETSPTASALFDETTMLAKAEWMSVQRFRTACSHLRHAADREGFLAAQVEESAWRTLRLKHRGDGAIELSGCLDAEGGALLRTTLEPLALPSGTDDDRCTGQRYADALVEICNRTLDAGRVPQCASERSHIRVTSSLETLLDLVGAPGGGVIASTTVRRLACDSTITRVLRDARSAVVDVGRSERVVAGATRRALNVRDNGCRWPGCSRPASWTAAHHIVHWAAGGKTNLENLVLLCRHHHWSVHEGGWQLLRADGNVVVLPPSQEWLARAREPALLSA